MSSISRTPDELIWNELRAISVGVTAIEETLTDAITNVRSHGAEGDGVTDDTDAIQAALDVVGTSTYGGDVYLPPGRYVVSDSLLIYSNTRLLGAGKGLSVLVAAAGWANTHVVNGRGATGVLNVIAEDNVRVEGITIDLETNSVVANGINILADGDDTTLVGTTQPTSVDVESCEILGFPSHQYLVWIFRGVDIRVLNCNLDGNAVAAGSGQNGIEVFGGDEILIAGNVVRNMSGVGIPIGAAAGIPGTSMSHIRVLGNHVEDCTNGITLNPAWDVTFGFQDLEDIVVEGNVIIDTRATALGVTSAYADCLIRDVLFDGNVVDGADVGLVVFLQPNDDKHRNIAFRGNAVRGCTTVTTGAVWLSYAYATVIENNDISDSAGNAIYAVGGTPIVRANRVVNTGEYVFESANLEAGSVIADNNIRDWNMNATPVAWAMRFTTATRTDVVRNTFSHVDSDPGSFPGRCTSLCIATGDEVTMRGNVTLRDSTGWSYCQNLATNPDGGDVAFVALDLTKTVLTTRASLSARVNVQQTAGTVHAFSVVHVVGPPIGFTITLDAAATGNETFRWWVENGAVA